MVGRIPSKPPSSSPECPHPSPREGVEGGPILKTSPLERKGKGDPGSETLSADRPKVGA